MHEFSIALSIVDIADEEVKKINAEKVERIELEIGKLSGIEIDSLEFIWDAAVKDSVLENARHDIIEKAGISECQDCKHRFPVEFIFNECPKCGSIMTTLISGKELRVKSLTLMT